MTLQLTEAERKLYDRERNRARMNRYREKRRWEVEQREARYTRLEEQNEALVAQVEQLKGGYARLKTQYEELRDGPLRERIVEKIVEQQVPTLFHVGNISAVMKLCNEAPPHWLEQLWAELKPRLEMAGIL